MFGFMVMGGRDFRTSNLRIGRWCMLKYTHVKIARLSRKKVGNHSGF